MNLLCELVKDQVDRRIDAVNSRENGSVVSYLWLQIIKNTITYYPKSTMNVLADCSCRACIYGSTINKAVPKPEIMYVQSRPGIFFAKDNIPADLN